MPSKAPAKKTPKKPLNENVVLDVRKKLQHMDFHRKAISFLDFGCKELNSVVGDEDRGLAYGKIVELSGLPSNGKSVLALDMLAAAQQDGALTFWVDVETSWDENWSARRGVDCSRVNLIQPMVGTFGKQKEKRLSTAQELLEQAEETMALLHRRFPNRPMFGVVDSVAALLMEEEAEVGLTGQNMKSNMALPAMMSKILRRWIGLLQVYGGTVIFINQLRINPMAWGDPYYTPGGQALPFYAHVRVRVHRMRKARLLKAGKLIGVKGVLKNLKNKAGGVEGSTCGYKIYFDGRSSFFPASEAKEAEEE